MKKSWYCVLLIFVGSLPVGYALQYYFAADAVQNAGEWNWLVIGAAAIGVLIIAVGLFKQVQANRAIAPENDKDGLLNLDDE